MVRLTFSVVNSLNAIKIKNLIALEILAQICLHVCSSPGFGNYRARLTELKIILRNVKFTCKTHAMNITSHNTDSDLNFLEHLKLFLLIVRFLA